MANVIRRQTPAARLARGLLYGVLILAALFYILPLVVMLMTAKSHFRAVDKSLGRSLHRDALRWRGRLLLELLCDCDSSGADLNHHWRSQRLRAN